MIISTIRLRLLLLAGVIMLATACSTKKNTFTRRVYHNINAKYNGYFNGRESLKEGVAELRKKTLDDYNRVLPVHNYGTPQDVQSIGPYMDKAIQKGSKVIGRHSMYFKKVEYNRWIDDSYLMIGQAYFYKQDYPMAARTFDFIIKRYNDPNMRYDASVWLARTHILQGNHSVAESMLDMLNERMEKQKAPVRYRRDLASAFAEYYIVQQNYPPAIEHLLKAERLTTRKADKNRLRFILAQIYQGVGELNEATKLYASVIRRNPPYEMAFKARINMAKCFDASTGNSKEIIKELNKMLADEKNEEYRDQIHYALAEIAMKEGDTPLVIEHLTKAVSTSVSNDYQKGLAALKLAEIYFEDPQYRPAQAYFDTAVQFLPKDYTNYEAIQTKSTRLNELVEHIETIELQDSLLRLANMPEAERIKVVDAIIQNLKQAEQEAQREQNQMRQGLGFIEQANREANYDRQGGANWYFYNPTALSFGYTEFLKKWGRRKLEDNWRLSNKIPTEIEFNNEALAENDSIEGDSAVVKVTDPKDRNYYLQDVPLTDEKKAASHQLIKSSLYNLGLIYDKGFNDVKRAIASYDTLLRRYPGDSLYALKVAYQLYKLYEESGDVAKRDYYKNMIIRDYPDSDYAMIIQDPSYYIKLGEERNREKTLYRQAFLAFNGNEHARVMQISNEVIRDAQDADLLPKFLFLRALTLGKTISKDSMAVVLQGLVEGYPKHDVSDLAARILEQMNGGDSAAVIPGGVKTTLAETSGKTEAISLYRNDPSAIHLYILIADIKNTNINALKIRISDYNKKYHSLDNLSISSLFLDDTRQLVTVSNFKDQALALQYINGIQGNTYVFSQLPEGTFDHFVISVENYPVLYRSKDLSSYREFYDKQYVKGP